MASSACWTCRARKKKCSGPSIDSLGLCTTCTNLNITCYGFGAAAKPSWLDGPTAADKRERVQRMEEIRRGVKITTEGLRRSRALTGLRRHWQGGEKEEGEFVAKSRAFGQETSTLCQNSSSNSSALTASTRNNGLFSNEFVTLHPHLEAVLLMHFFDVILPLQFPFYQPPVADDWKGWMLALLLQTRPLYDAALSLSAWHRNSIMLAESGKRSPDHGETGDKRQVTENKFEQQLYVHAISGLRGRVESLSQMGPDDGLKDSIEVLASVVQLILLEVSKGDMENWQKHLLAAPDLHVFLSTYCTRHHLISKPSANYCETSTTGESKSSLSLVDHAAMAFFSGVIIWFDILGSASTGLRPQYADICAAALGDFDSKVQLQNLMGCENWAMTIIREIAVLEDWKRVMARDGVLSVRKLVRKAGDIEQRLGVGIARLTGRFSEVPSLHGAYAMYSSHKYLTDITVSRITYIFACAAQVYLNVVVSGPNPNLPEMRNSVVKSLAAFSALPDPELIRNVAWPFCIAGCMAAADQEQNFRNLASMARIDEHTFGTSWRAAEVMETCWMMRKSSEMDKTDCDWFTAMKKLGSQILLV